MASMITEVASVSSTTRSLEAAPGTVFGAADALMEPLSNGAVADSSLLRKEPSMVAEELEVADDEDENVKTRYDGLANTAIVLHPHLDVGGFADCTE
jgi:hypothetical protein